MATRLDISYHLLTDYTHVNQDVLMEIGIEGDTYGFTKTIGVTIEDIDLDLGKGIPEYINNYCLQYIKDNYPNI